MKFQILNGVRKIAWMTLLFSLVVFIAALASLYLWFFVAQRWDPWQVGCSATAMGAGLLLIAFSIWLFRMSNKIDLEWEEAKPAPAVSVAPPPAPAAKSSGDTPEPGAEALMLVSLFQEKGRLVDFLMEDIAAYSNDQVGAAARVVHQGCREVVSEIFSPQPVSPSAENTVMTLEPGYDAAEFRLVGNIQGEPPFTGKVMHKGWRARSIKLPRRHGAGKSVESPIIVPAEVAV